jgi:drug/metabolite transporter superfamily protein YnfA
MANHMGTRGALREDSRRCPSWDTKPCHPPPLSVGSAAPLLAAFAGCFLIYAFTTTHWSVYWNENIFQMTPFSVPLVLLAPVAIFGRRWAVRWGLIFSLAALLCSLLGFILQVLPGFFQVNGAIIALCLPIHLGLALSMYILSGRLPPPAAANASAPPRKKAL